MSSRHASSNCDNGSAAITTPSAACVYPYEDTAQVYTIELTVTDAGLAGPIDCKKSDTVTVTVNVPAGTVVALP
jgi:hypothetical protein